MCRAALALVLLICLTGVAALAQSHDAQATDGWETGRWRLARARLHGVNWFKGVCFAGDSDQRSLSRCHELISSATQQVTGP